jgi:hypothetical protein
MNNNKLPSGYYIKPYRPITPIALPRNVWSQSEIEYVLKLIQEKRKPEEIARKINRPISEVRSKLKVIAADMYIKDNMPYEKIQDLTGIEKKTLILSPLNVKHEKIEDYKEGDDHIIINISKCDPEQDEKPSRQIDIDVKENKEELTITVAFTAETICEQITTPIIRTFTMFSRFTKTIVGLEDTMLSSS